MNEKTIRLLEFDAIRSRVAALALSEEAGKIILSDEPKTNSAEIDELKNQVASVMERMAILGGEKREALPELFPILSKLEVDGASLDIDEAYALLIFLLRAETLKQWLSKPLKPVEAFTETNVFPELPDCNDVSKEILKIIDHEGKLRELPEFRDIKRRIKNLQKEIDSSGALYSGSEEKRRMLQSEIPSQRDGRLVLAVKAKYKGRIKGIVHEVSSTGQTIFIEPEEVVEMNNELLIQTRRLEAEIRKVLRELSSRIALSLENLKVYHRTIIFLETIRARARYGFEQKNVFAKSSGFAGLLSTEEKLVLKQARHPLLAARAVPLDLYMQDGIRVVIITGPNTGGKTVALKTLGLLAMMNQFGLPLPSAGGTVLPVFDSVYADIGDEQSLSQSLSTFSSHMTNISEIIRSSTERSLVLLDELGSGTDPEEGSAIAMAILDHFIEVKARLIVTTHHGILKNYGYTRDGVENASMEFDSRTLSPTYKIVMGIPGESRAVDIAGRNGFPPLLVNRARSYLDKERTDVSALIAGLKEKHKELDAAAEAGKREEMRLLEERRQADLKELRLRQKELQLRSGGVGHLKDLLGESRKTLENLVREVQEAANEAGQQKDGGMSPVLGREKTLKVKEFLSNLEAQIEDESKKIERERQELYKESGNIERAKIKAEGNNGISPGSRVLAGESRIRGRVLRLDKKGSKNNTPSWIVEIGSIKSSFPEKDLVLLDEDDSSIRKNSWSLDLASNSPLSIELSIRGMRLNEALAALSRQIDDAVLGGLHGFAVVHGKGEGILSKGVHDYLKNEPRVADYFFSRPEAGGFGRTEVVLK